MIDVTIPVGPSAANRRWLKDALDSVRAQTMRAAHIILIDDSEGTGAEGITEVEYGSDVRIYANPWRSGVAHSFNYGVALAPSECVLMMGSDDLLEPTCLEACWSTYNEHDKAAAYYWLDVHYMNRDVDQSIACNAAMTTKKLWKMTGGIPIEAACGAGDAALLSIMMVNMPERMIRVKTDKPLYLYRDHPETDTVRRSRWHQIIIDVRGLVTDEWTKNFNIHI